MSLLRDPETDHLIGIEQAPHHQALPVAEYPKWVVAHESHVARRKVEGAPDIVSVPSFADFAVNRHDGAVMVLAADEEQEKLATSESRKDEPTDVRSAGVVERTRLEVARDIERAKVAQDAAAIRQVADDHARMVEEEAIRRTEETRKREAADREATDKLAAESRERIAKSVARGNAPLTATEVYEPLARDPVEAIKAPPEQETIVDG